MSDEQTPSDLPPDIQQTALLNEFVRGMTEMVNIFLKGDLEPHYVADALLSGSAEIIRKQHGAALAADMLRNCADIVEREARPH